LKRLTRFLRLSFREKLLFSEALFFHLLTGLILKTVPFRKIPELFSSRQAAVSSHQSDVTGQIKEAVARAGKVSPWRNRCLVSSLAARCMLNRRKIQSSLSLGMAKKMDGKNTAHAWLKAGDREIVERTAEFTELYTF